jgi:hypothetical protein
MLRKKKKQSKQNSRDSDIKIEKAMEVCTHPVYVCIVPATSQDFVEEIDNLRN